MVITKHAMYFKIVTELLIDMHVIRLTILSMGQSWDSIRLKKLTWMTNPWMTLFIGQRYVCFWLSPGITLFWTCPWITIYMSISPWRYPHALTKMLFTHPHKCRKLVVAFFPHYISFQKHTHLCQRHCTNVSLIIMLFLNYAWFIIFDW